MSSYTLGAFMQVMRTMRELREVVMGFSSDTLFMEMLRQVDRQLPHVGSIRMVTAWGALGCTGLVETLCQLTRLRGIYGDWRSPGGVGVRLYNDLQGSAVAELVFQVSDSTTDISDSTTDISYSTTEVPDSTTNISYPTSDIVF